MYLLGKVKAQRKADPPLAEINDKVNRDLHAKQFCTMRYENKQYISLAVIEVEERETPVGLTGQVRPEGAIAEGLTARPKESECSGTKIPLFSG